MSKGSGYSRKNIIALSYQDPIVKSVLSKRGITNDTTALEWETILIELVIELVMANKTLKFYESLEVGDSDQHHNPGL